MKGEIVQRRQVTSEGVHLASKERESPKSEAKSYLFTGGEGGGPLGGGTGGGKRDPESWRTWPLGPASAC